MYQEIIILFIRELRMYIMPFQHKFDYALYSKVPVIVHVCLSENPQCLHILASYSLIHVRSFKFPQLYKYLNTLQEMLFHHVFDHLIIYKCLYGCT